MTAADETPSRFKILSLDGGGAKGFYTLGVLKEIEGLVGRPLHEELDLISGTSTGAIIAAPIALGRGIDEIHALYLEYVPKIMEKKAGVGKVCCVSRAGKHRLRGRDVR